MSLKRNCDGCGRVMQDEAVEHDYPDLAVYIGDSEKPAYEYEDLCPICRDRLVCAIENALVDCDIDQGPAVESGIPVSEAVSAEPDEDTAIPPAVDPSDDIETEPAPVVEAGDRQFANGIVGQFPIKSMYAANR